jgi:pyrrolidone-carboxylate peptidase
MPTRGMLTAFRPFMGREQNQSQLVCEGLVAADALPKTCGQELWPVDLAALACRAKERLADRAENLVAGRAEERLAGAGPSLSAEPPLKYWLALGEAGRDGVPLLETLAYNSFDLAKDPSSAGKGAVCGVLQPMAPPTLLAHWPAAALREHLLESGFDVDLSCDAGRHCCNALLFEATFAALDLRPRPWIGFLHLPRCADELDQQVKLVAAALAWLDQQFL